MELVQNITKVEFALEDKVKRAKSVVIDGKGDTNFSFSFALAAWLGKWDTITPSNQKSDINITEVKLLNIEYAMHNCEEFSIPPEVTLKSIRQCSNLPREGFSKPKKLEEISDVDVAWLQCPWEESTDDDLYPIPKLIEEFMELMASKLSKDGILLIGIVKKFPYCMGFCIEKFLHEVQGSIKSRIPDYELIGQDDTVVKKTLSYGYKFQAPIGDLHDVFLKHHITLVFTKNVN